MMIAPSGVREAGFITNGGADGQLRKARSSCAAER